MTGLESGVPGSMLIQPMARVAWSSSPEVCAMTYEEIMAHHLHINMGKFAIPMGCI